MVEKKIIEEILTRAFNENTITKCRNYWGLSDVSLFDSNGFKEAIFPSENEVHKYLDEIRKREGRNVTQEEVLDAYEKFLLSDLEKIQDSLQNGTLTTSDLVKLADYSWYGHLSIAPYIYKTGLYLDGLNKAKSIDDEFNDRWVNGEYHTTRAPFDKTQAEWMEEIKEQYDKDGTPYWFTVAETDWQGRDIYELHWQYRTAEEYQEYLRINPRWYGDVYKELSKNGETHYNEKKYLKEAKSKIYWAKKEAKDLDEIIDKAPTLAQDTVLYRGGVLPSDLKVGEVSKFKSITSTSYHPDVPNTFLSDEAKEQTRDLNEERYYIKIYAPQGTKGARINREVADKGGSNLIPNLTEEFDRGAYASENELILHSNQRYQVLSINHETHEAEILLINEGYVYR